MITTIIGIIMATEYNEEFVLAVLRAELTDAQMCLEIIDLKDMEQHLINVIEMCLFYYHWKTSLPVPYLVKILSSRPVLFKTRQNIPNDQLFTNNLSSLYADFKENGDEFMAQVMAIALRKKRYLI